MIIIDRFEETFAVLETDSGFIDVPQINLPKGAKEGDLLIQTPDGYLVDTEATAARRNQLLARTKNRKEK